MVDPGSNSLVLVCERPELLRSALALVAAQDRALRTVVLEYQSQRESELASEGLRVDWGVATGGLRIGNLIVPAGDSRVRVAAQAQRGRSSASLGGTRPHPRGSIGADRQRRDRCPSPPAIAGR